MLCGLFAVVLAALALALPPLGSLPAAAAPPALRVTLSQSSDASAIGSPLILTATVTWTGGEATEPTDGWFVEFTGTGDGGWTSGPVPTDDGEASYTRSSPVAQTETITARIANVGCTQTTSNTVTHEWWRGEIVITNPDVSSDINTDFTLAGRVLRSGEPVADAEVSIVIVAWGESFDPDNPGAPGADPTRLAIAAETDDAGDFAGSWTSSVVSIERVEISVAGADGYTAAAGTSHSWSGSDPTTSDLTLTANARERVGDRLLATSQRGLFEQQPTDQGIRFLTNLGWQESNTDRPADEARYSYAALFSPGWGAIGARSSATGFHVSRTARWWQPTITFVSPNSSSVVGQDFPATVVVTDDGVPVPGVALAFSLDGSDAPYGTATTDANGYASAPLAVAGEDSPTIDVAEVLDNDENPADGAPIAATATTDHTWVAAPAGVGVLVNLTQSSQESRIGTGVELTAELFVGDGAVEGWDVAFAADEDSLGVRVTNENGIATVTTPPNDVESYALFTATVAIAGCTSQTAEVFHYWWEPDLDLTPKGTTSPARNDVTFTAALTRFTSSEDTVAVPGQLVRFTMTSQSCSLPVAVSHDRTNDDGIAAVTLSRDGPSIDSIQAEEIGVVGPASDATTHTWGAPVPPPLSIALTQNAAASRAGSEVIITATVTDADRPGGRARAGIPVTFLGVSPTRTVPTDASGVARLTVVGTTTSPTTVTASAPFGCGVVLSGSVTHRSFVPTLELTPDFATTTTGDTTSVTAVLTDGQNRVAGQEIALTVDHRASGVDTLARTETTDTNGEAKFTWTRTEAGFDDLTAVELTDVQPQQDTARHLWERGPTTPPAIPDPDPDPPPPAVITPTQSPAEPTPEDEPSESPAPTPSATPTETPAAPPPTVALPSDLPATSTLVDGPEVGRPGADIEVSGTGCRPGQSLTVRLGETSLGRTRAAADGTFYLRGVVPDLPLGRYLIRSTCGTTIGDPNVDITAPQVNKARAAIAAVGVTTASTFVFFLLLAKGVISFLPRRPY